jgi:hypothetical protein
MYNISFAKTLPLLEITVTQTTDGTFTGVIKTEINARFASSKGCFGYYKMDVDTENYTSYLLHIAAGLCTLTDTQIEFKIIMVYNKTTKVWTVTLNLSASYELKWSE